MLQNKTLKNGLVIVVSLNNTYSTMSRTKGPEYTLTYFAVKGVAEGIRFLLCYMDADWEDNRVELDQWATFKPKTPWGLMPLLEENGKVLPQSHCIMRYLGNKIGLTGADDWENAQIDSIADTLEDLRIPASAFMWERNPEVKKRKKEVWLKETLPYYMKNLNTVVKKNGGYLANGKLSWVDFFFVGMLDYLSYNADVEAITANYPDLHGLKRKIISLPQVAQWIVKRPRTLF